MHYEAILREIKRYKGFWKGLKMHSHFTTSLLLDYSYTFTLLKPSLSRME